ncbi:hypothetical protein ETD86_13055 [Nonomuraea turkmeniaca]|uniref:FtsK domain-containing protein n=1 Tax=Nonomuraea turkmeniaca TaxID=103838 RepID=A0A5S4FPH1_9ACTN|nr:hypothetical protein [Nonomuraea turkmeniaca]TMR22091.1 hypothetical protein ETD86_13055 [Nonomuraea turkmeniaca]
MDHPSADTQPAHPAGDDIVLNGQVIKRSDLTRATSGIPAPWTAPLTPPLIIRDPKLAGLYAVRVAARVPGRLLGAALRGTGVLGNQWWMWANAVNEQNRAFEAGRYDTNMMAALDALRTQRRTASAKVAGAVVAGSVLLFALNAWPILAGAGTIWVAVAAIAGRRTPEQLRALGHAADAGRSAVGAAGAPAVDASVSSEQLTEAFIAASIIKAGQEVHLDAARLPHHDGTALIVVVRLPAGRTHKQVIAAKAALASALDIDERWLDVERVPGTGRHVSLWLADSDPFDRPKHRSPLIGADAWDLFHAVPFGTSIRGRRVALPLIFTSVLVSSMPRMGKSVVLRLLAMAAALDVRVRLYLWDGKGGKDFSPFKSIAHGFGRGVRGRTVEELYTALCALVAEMGALYEWIDELDDDICPDGKITPEMLDDPSYGLTLKLIIIDEVQRYLEDPVWGKLILEQLIELAKVGPALGFILVIATQKADADTIPSSLRDQLGTRFVLRVMTWQASEAGLGTNTHVAGYNAAEFDGHHQGWGFLRGAEDVDLGGDILTVRSDFADVRDARQVVKRALELREQAGMLPGQQRPGAPAPVIADPRERVPAVLAAIAELAAEAAGEHLPRLSTTAIIAQLELKMSPKALGGMLADWGCPVGRQTINGDEVRGPATADVLAAVDRIVSGGAVEVRRAA